MAASSRPSLHFTPGRTAVLCLVAALAAGTVFALLGAIPLQEGDALGSSLLTVPWIVAALWAVRCRLRGQGHWVAGRIPQLFDAVALAVLMLMVPARSHLGLDDSAAVVNRVLVGGFLVLFGLHLVRYLPSLRRLLGEELSSRPSALFWFLPVLAYLAIIPWSAGQRPPDGDEPYYLLITHSLVYDFDTELTNNYDNEDSRLYMPRAIEPEWADPRGPNGEVYSRHTMLLPLLMAPFYRLAGYWGAMLFMAILTGGVAWMTLRMGHHYWRRHPAGALAAWALLAFTPPLLLYSHQIWVEVPAALLVLLALDRIHSLAGESRPRSWFVLVASIVVLPLLKLRLILLAIPLVGLAWWRVPRSRRALGALALLLVLVAAGVLAYNQTTYGNPFKDHTWDQLRRIQSKSPFTYAKGAFGLLWDSAFGLFATNPLWLLVLPSLALTAWRRRPQAFDLLACSALYLAVVSPRAEWYGAWSPPFRLGLALLPLLALSLVPALDAMIERANCKGANCKGEKRREGRRILTAALGSLALGLTLLWVAAPGWTYNFADGGSHLLDRITLLLGADVLRFFPSFVRPRAATWLWPVLTLVVSLGLWWLPLSGKRWRLGGVVALLAGLALLPWAANHVTTAIVEFEDLQVHKTGGELYPEPWVPVRPRFRGGWRLAGGETLTAPVVVGGTTASVTLELQVAQPPSESAWLEVGAGERPPTTWILEPGRQWRKQLFAIENWQPGEALRVRLVDPSSGGSNLQVIVDRATIEWR